MTVDVSVAGLEDAGFREGMTTAALRGTLQVLTAMFLER